MGILHRTSPLAHVCMQDRLQPNPPTPAIGYDNEEGRGAPSPHAVYLFHFSPLRFSSRCKQALSAPLLGAGMHGRRRRSGELHSDQQATGERKENLAKRLSFLIENVGETHSRRKNPRSTCASDAVGKKKLDEMPTTSPALYCTGTISGLLLHTMFSPVQVHLYPGKGA